MDLWAKPLGLLFKGKMKKGELGGCHRAEGRQPRAVVRATARAKSSAAGTGRVSVWADGALQWPLRSVLSHYTGKPMRQGHREVKQLSQSYTAGRWHLYGIRLPGATVCHLHSALVAFLFLMS